MTPTHLRQNGVTMSVERRKIAEKFRGIRNILWAVRMECRLSLGFHSDCPFRRTFPVTVRLFAYILRLFGRAGLDAPSVFRSFGASSKSRLFVRRKRGAVRQSSGHCFCKHRKNVHFCRLQGMPLTPMPPAGGRLPRRCRKKQCRNRAFRPAPPFGVFLIITFPILLRKGKIKRTGENAIRITRNYPILSRDNLMAVFFMCKSTDNEPNTQKSAL